jgi:hypothetical protein
MVCLPHTLLEVLLPPLITVRQWLGAAIMLLLTTGNSRSRRVRRAEDGELVDLHHARLI